MNTRLFETRESLTAALCSRRMDSSFENDLAASVRAADTNLKLALLEAVLSSDRATTRALGLRVLRRTVSEHGVVDALLDQCFRLRSYGEIELWYESILARYPLMRLVHRLRSGVIQKGDVDLSLLHIRALQMWRAKSPMLKRQALALLQNELRNMT